MSERRERSRPMLSIRADEPDVFRVTVRVTGLNYVAMAHAERDKAHGLPCMYCWEPMDGATWDHVIPISKGGPNTRENLVVVCRRCNHDKGDLSLPEYEGLLRGIQSPIGHRVDLFTQWVIRDWTDEDKEALAAIVEDARQEAERANLKPDKADTIEVRAGLSRMLRSRLHCVARTPKPPPLRLVETAVARINSRYPVGAA